MAAVEQFAGVDGLGTVSRNALFADLRLDADAVGLLRVAVDAYLTLIVISSLSMKSAELPLSS